MESRNEWRRAHVASMLIKIGDHITTIMSTNEDIIDRVEMEHLACAAAALVQALASLNINKEI